MFFCSKCHRLMPSEVCSFCGKKRLSPVQAEDAVLFMELGAMDAMFAEPLLADSGIAYYRDGRLGSALATTIGIGLETTRLYVSYGQLAEATALMAETFGEEADILKNIVTSAQQ